MTILGIMASDYSSLLCFLVDLAEFFDCPHPIPRNVTLVVTSIHTVNGSEIKKTLKHSITSSGGEEQENNESSNDDVFEELIDSEEKLDEVCQLLLTFVNNNMEEIGIQVDDLSDLHDGHHLILLSGMVGSFFVPFNHYFRNPATDEEKVRGQLTFFYFYQETNLILAFQLLQKMQLDVSKLSVDAFLAKDLRVIARSVYLIQNMVK